MLNQIGWQNLKGFLEIKMEKEKIKALIEIELEAIDEGENYRIILPDFKDKKIFIEMEQDDTIKQS